MPKTKLSTAEQSRKAFAGHYRRHVLPGLRNLIIAEARCVARRVETFSAACYVVISHARQLGGLHLEREVWDGIEAWIEQTMAEEVAQAERDGWHLWPNLKRGTKAWDWVHGGAS